MADSIKPSMALFKTIACEIIKIITTLIHNNKFSIYSHENMLTHNMQHLITC